MNPGGLGGSEVLHGAHPDEFVKIVQDGFKRFAILVFSKVVDHGLGHPQGCGQPRDY